MEKHLRSPPILKPDTAGIEVRWSESAIGPSLRASWQPSPETQCRLRMFTRHVLLRVCSECDSLNVIDWTHFVAFMCPRKNHAYFGVVSGADGAPEQPTFNTDRIRFFIFQREHRTTPWIHKVAGRSSSRTPGSLFPGNFLKFDLE